MIVWGSGGDRVNLGQVDTRACATCEKDRPFYLFLTYRYWGLYWVFNVVTEKTYFLACEICQRGWELESHKVEATVKSVPIPFMRRWGLAVLGGLIAAVVLLTQL